MGPTEAQHTPRSRYMKRPTPQKIQPSWSRWPQGDKALEQRAMSRSGNGSSFQMQAYGIKLKWHELRATWQVASSSENATKVYRRKAAT
ncbi:hypothetical protein L7F22_056143 [Adiantum nelumboides]|nr:hypothetical protein [Adiantum nelumboides]